MFRFLRRQTARWLLLFGATELLLLIFSLQVAIRLRYLGSFDDRMGVSHHLMLRSLLFSLVILLGMAALGEYRTHLRASALGIAARQAVAFILGGLLLIVCYYVVPQAYVGRGVLGLALLIGFFAVMLFRLAFMRLVELESLKPRIMILGAGHRAAQVHTRMRRRSDRRGFTLIGYLQAGQDDAIVPVDHVLKRDCSLMKMVQRHQINEIVVGVDDRRGGLPMDELLECRQAGVLITELSTFFERESGRVQLTSLEPSWLIFSEGFNASPMRRISKRSFDVITAVVLLTLLWPAMLLVALAIRLESGPGQPILYRQERVGESGKSFWLLKFRSMRTDAERDGVARWASKQDDRVTRVGRFCRKCRLDELPQLWNVLRNEMSIVGPRPERPQFVADLATKIPFYSLRHCLKPGLAGWAQLSYPYGASEADAAEKLKYDIFYVKNHNLLLDMMILIETVEVVLFNRGAR